MVLAAAVSATIVVVHGKEARRSPAVVPPSAPPTAPARPLQPTPGNLLANGDFERDLDGWTVLGNGRADRVAVAHSGAWAVRIRANQPELDQPRSQRPGIVVASALQSKQGRSYHASAWVHARRPGTEVVLALREYDSAGKTSADVIGVTLPDTGWHEIAVDHQVHQPGARLALEATAINLRPGDDLLVDQVSLTAS